jgi:hypothetical protein
MIVGFQRDQALRSGRSISHDEATRHASDTEPYTKLCGEVALTIEGKVNWTGSAKRDADAALVVFKQELAKIDLSTAPAGLTGSVFVPEWFQVLVGNILAMDADPYNFTISLETTNGTPGIRASTTVSKRSTQ